MNDELPLWAAIDGLSAQAMFGIRPMRTPDAARSTARTIDLCMTDLLTDEGPVLSDGVLQVRLSRGDGLHVEVTGSTGPQQQVLSDLGLDPWAVMRGLVEDGGVVEP